MGRQILDTLPRLLRPLVLPRQAPRNASCRILMSLAESTIPKRQGRRLPSHRSKVGTFASTAGFVDSPPAKAATFHVVGTAFVSLTNPWQR